MLIFISIINSNQKYTYKLDKASKLINNHKQMDHTYSSEFEVQDILDEKIIDNQTHYLVKWKGYCHDQNTWEPNRHMVNCDQQLQSWEKYKQKLSKKLYKEKSVLHSQYTPTLTLKQNFKQNSPNKQSNLDVLIRQNGIDKYLPKKQSKIQKAQRKKRQLQIFEKRIKSRPKTWDKYLVHQQQKVRQISQKIKQVIHEVYGVKPNQNPQVQGQKQGNQQIAIIKQKTSQINSQQLLKNKVNHKHSKRQIQIELNKSQQQLERQSKQLVGKDKLQIKENKLQINKSILHIRENKQKQKQTQIILKLQDSVTYNKEEQQKNNPTRCMNKKKENQVLKIQETKGQTQNRHVENSTSQQQADQQKKFKVNQNRFNQPYISNVNTGNRKLFRKTQNTSLVIEPTTIRLTQQTLNQLLKQTNNNKQSKQNIMQCQSEQKMSISDQNAKKYNPQQLQSKGLEQFSDTQKLNAKQQLLYQKIQIEPIKQKIQIEQLQNCQTNNIDSLNLISIKQYQIQPQHSAKPFESSLSTIQQTAHSNYLLSNSLAQMLQILTSLLQIKIQIKLEEANGQNNINANQDLRYRIKTQDQFHQQYDEQNHKAQHHSIQVQQHQQIHNYTSISNHLSTTLPSQMTSRPTNHIIRHNNMVMNQQSASTRGTFQNYQHKMIDFNIILPYQTQQNPLKQIENKIDQNNQVFNRPINELPLKIQQSIDVLDNRKDKITCKNSIRKIYIPSKDKQKKNGEQRNQNKNQFFSQQSIELDRQKEENMLLLINDLSSSQYD